MLNDAQRDIGIRFLTICKFNNVTCDPDFRSDTRRWQYAPLSSTLISEDTSNAAIIANHRHTFAATEAIMDISGTYQIQANDLSGYWSDDYSVMIANPPMPTMKLTFSTTSLFKIIPDSNSNYKLIISCNKQLYLQWQANDDNTHFSLAPSSVPAGTDLSKIGGKFDASALQFQFNAISSGSSSSSKDNIPFTLCTRTGYFLTKAGAWPPYVDGQAAQSNDSIFLLQKAP